MRLDEVNGIWYPAQLFRNFVDATVSIGDRAMEEQLQTWQTQRIDRKRLAEDMADWIDPEIASCGSGHASTIQNTAARLTPSEKHADCYSSNTPGEPTPPHPIQWSHIERRSFLLAWQRLSAVYQVMRNHGVRTHMKMYGPAAIQRYEPTTAPVPFLLPWPIAGGRNDHRQAPRWNSDELGAMQYHSQTATSLAQLHLDPQHQPADIDTSLSVTHLSSVVRGCPWALDVNHASSPPLRLRQEMGIIARRMARSMHLNAELGDSILAYPHTHYAGVRPLGTTYTGASQIESTPTSGTRLDQLFIGHSGGELETQCATSIAQLLHSSFLVSFGSEHLEPWPIMIVAPIAPGWIGGFLGGANSFE